MQPMIESALRDWTFLITTGLGISFAPNVWLGGLFLALAGASMAFRHDPERDTRERWSVFVTAAVIAHIVAIIAHWAKPEFPPQLAMFVAGIMSRRIVRFFFKLADRLEHRSDTIADRLVDRVLPGQGPEPSYTPETPAYQEPNNEP